MLTELETKLINGTNFLFVATVNPDGSPQVSPVWAEVVDGLVVINTSRGRVKERNLVRDGRVGLSVLDAADPYTKVSFRGEVVEITEDGADQHVDGLSRKYTGGDFAYHEPGANRVVIKIKKTS